MISVQLVTENVKPYATGLDEEVKKPDEVTLMKCTNCLGTLVPASEEKDSKPFD